MKVIFLDVDGVLNSRTYMESLELEDRQDHKKHFMPEKLELLKEIVDRTGAKVVISSTWRVYHLEILEEVLAEYDIKPIGVTPQFTIYGHMHKRWEEIKAWKNGRPIDSFVVLDDYPVLQDSHPAFARTDTWKGLTRVEVDKAIAHLGESDEMPGVPEGR